MGRLATHVAAAFTDADNLPPAKELPRVSFIDALLPRSLTGYSPSQTKKERTPTDPNIGRKMAVTYYDIKKDKNGKRSIVAHKSPAGSAAGGKDEDKNGNGGKDKGGKNGGNDKKKDNDEKKKEGGSGDGGGGENKDDQAFTPEEDARLIALKTEEKGKSWKDIGAELGRSKQVLIARWKEIDPSKNGGGEATKAEDKKGDAEKNKGGGKKGKGGGGEGGKEMGGGGDGEGKKNKKEKQNKKDEKSAKAPSKVGSVKGGAGEEARFTTNEWLTLQEDDLFSFGELQCLSELIMKDQDQTWIRVASAFYDKTGRRVHPDDIREKFESMAAMG